MAQVGEREAQFRFVVPVKVMRELPADVLAEAIAALHELEGGLLTELHVTPQGDGSRLAEGWTADKRLIGLLGAMAQGDEASIRRLTSEIRGSLGQEDADG